MRGATLSLVAGERGDRDRRRSTRSAPGSSARSRCTAASTARREACRSRASSARRATSSIATTRSAIAVRCRPRRARCSSPRRRTSTRAFSFAVLRGAVALPTRALLFAWRRGCGAQDGTLTPVTEARVRAALRRGAARDHARRHGALRRAARGDEGLAAPVRAVGGHDRASGIRRRRRRRRSRRCCPACRGTACRRSACRRACAATGPGCSRRPRAAASGARRSRGPRAGRRIVIVGASGLWRWALSRRRERATPMPRSGAVYSTGSPRSVPILAPRFRRTRSCAPAIAIRWRRGTGNDTLVSRRAAQAWRCRAPTR